MSWAWVGPLVVAGGAGVVLAFTAGAVRRENARLRASRLRASRLHGRRAAGVEGTSLASLVGDGYRP